MSEEKRGSEILGALPQTRPQRRSDKRPPRAGGPPPPADEPRALAGSGPAAARTVSPPAEPGAPIAPRAGQVKTAPRSKPVPKAASRRIAQPAQPRGAPPSGAPPGGERGESGSKREPERGARSRDPLAAAVQTAAEVAEFGLTASTKVLRRALSKLPRP